ncbi:MAG: ATPase domain-containing protein, partial [Phycisphaeraceae bacterium]
KQLDPLLGGWLGEGSACLITCTSGSGKSTLTSLYAQAAAERGERSAIFCFDERRETFLRRSEGLGMNVGRYVDEGLIDLRQYDVGKILPDEFMQTVCHAVDVDHAKVVVIDSITGYINAMPNERALMLQLHKLLSYLGDRGVLTLLVVSAQGAFGASQPTIDTSYLADTVIMMRHFEARGKMSRCIAALKKRHGPHESAIREIQMGQGGMRIGPPLTQFSGVLTGTPKFEGPRESLLEHGGEPEA